MGFFTTVLSLSTISVVLSILIIIAEQRLNDYGDCKIAINQDRNITVKGGASLLSVLAEEGIFIPSACGGKATCGLCKVRIIQGGGPVLPTEEPFLTAQEKDEGFRLSCQVKVKEDLTIVIPEELFSIQAYETVIQSIEQLTHDIKGLRLDLPENETISFKAGQYVQVYTEPYGKIKESVFRAYSMASVPSDNRAIELIVRLVPDGICTTYVHDVLKVGDKVTVSGPFGDFYLRGQAKRLVFIAGGSGLAPIRSLILDILEKGLSFEMVFFFGAVTRKDLYYVSYFEELAQKHAQFTFIPALSGPLPDDQWTGETGLITAVVDRHIADGADTEAYLCGSPGMIDACLKVLHGKGIDDEKIFYDKF